ncbi:hypothetical protein FSP39_024779 [Pinctada imbricata]|uniref:G-protein coupled receptors family 1 profile domain-containing protein n=1 Tax=Pinctada imbricata TaxID=66713 RepID=A0AA88XV15_PINIB|nr:hypothetical protein FSP39_024779 [Pinctada imbricata]
MYYNDDKSKCYQEETYLLRCLHVENAIYKLIPCSFTSQYDVIGAKNKGKHDVIRKKCAKACNVQIYVGIYFEVCQTEQIVFLSILLAVIVLANGIVLLTIYSTRKMRSPMHFFIANLATADLLVGLLFISTDLALKVNYEWTAGDALCKVAKCLHAVAAYGSNYALVALSIDRLISVARPLKSLKKGRRTRTLISLSWICAILFSLFMLLFGTRVAENGKVYCSIDFKEKWMWKVYFLLTAFAVFIIPVIIIALCYIVIVIIIWKKSSFNVGMEESNDEQLRIFSRDADSECSTPMKILNKRQVHWTETGSSSRGLIPKAKIKTVKMTFVIVLAFIFCWSPYFIYNLLFAYGHIPDSQSATSTTIFMQTLAPVNSAVNPFIYFLFNSQTYMRLFKQNGSNSHVRSPTSTRMSQV